ncbi:MAG: hypothetical protein WBF80_04465 [Rhodococcus sp. (in: high G+C Gram-positive bacteria)]
MATCLANPVMRLTRVATAIEPDAAISDFCGLGSGCGAGSDPPGGIFVGGTVPDGAVLDEG